MRLVGVAWGEGHIGEAAAVTAGGESGGPCSLRMLVWAVSQIMFFGVLTGIALKKKKRWQRDLPKVSDWQLVGQDAAQVCRCQARPVHQAPTQQDFADPSLEAALGLCRRERGSGVTLSQGPC